MCLKHKTANAVHGKIDTDASRCGGGRGRGRRFTKLSTKWPTAAAWEIKGANKKNLSLLLHVFLSRIKSSLGRT